MDATPPAQDAEKPVKFGRILDEADGRFALQYENTLGQKNRMRLDADEYERAIREARDFLEINTDNRDPDGNVWEIE